MDRSKKNGIRRLYIVLLYIYLHVLFSLHPPLYYTGGIYFSIHIYLEYYYCIVAILLFTVFNNEFNRIQRKLFFPHAVVIIIFLAGHQAGQAGQATRS